MNELAERLDKIHSLVYKTDNKNINFLKIQGLRMNGVFEV